MVFTILNNQLLVDGRVFDTSLFTIVNEIGQMFMYVYRLHSR